MYIDPVTSFDEALSLVEKSKSLIPSIESAGRIMIHSLKAGGKILCCGNGGSACDAQHFASELVGRFMREREPLPAISLCTDPSVVTSVANDFGYQDVFSRQVLALGRGKDILLAITTSGNSDNIYRAIVAARLKHMGTVLLSGGDGGPAATAGADVEIRVPSEDTPRIQEIHLMIVHALCEQIDASVKHGE